MPSRQGACVREVAERMIHPRCLDDYTSVAYGCAERAGWPDGEYGAPSTPELDSPLFEDALTWAEAGVRVIRTEPAMAIRRLSNLAMD